MDPNLHFVEAIFAKQGRDAPDGGSDDGIPNFIALLIESLANQQEARHNL